eukprot:6021817-Pleurochrysis_carterae.AAC.2
MTSINIIKYTDVDVRAHKLLESKVSTCNIVVRSNVCGYLPNEPPPDFLRNSTYREQIIVGAILILSGGCMHLHTYFQMASNTAAHGGRRRLVLSSHSSPVSKQVVVLVIKR